MNNIADIVNYNENDKKLSNLVLKENCGRNDEGIALTDDCDAWSGKNYKKEQ